MCIRNYQSMHLKICFDGEFGQLPLPIAIGKGGKELIPTNDGRI